MNERKIKKRSQFAAKSGSMMTGGEWTDFLPRCAFGRRESTRFPVLSAPEVILITLTQREIAHPPHPSNAHTCGHHGADSAAGNPASVGRPCTRPAAEVQLVDQTRRPRRAATIAPPSPPCQMMGSDRTATPAHRFPSAVGPRRSNTPPTAVQQPHARPTTPSSHGRWTPRPHARRRRAVRRRLSGPRPSPCRREPRQMVPPRPSQADCRSGGRGGLAVHVTL